MADVNKTIDIVFGALDRTGNTLTNIGQNINATTDSISGISGPLADVTTGLLKTEAAIISLAAAYGGFAISKAIEFQDAQIDLAKVLGENDPKIESFTDTVIELSEQYGVASSSILQGIANFKQSGFTAEEAALLQKNALDLVIAGDVEATQATEILVASLKGFGAEATESARFIEALNNVSNEFATDLGELAVGMARVSPVAKQMGFTFEETTGLITPVIEVFRSGPEAANALRTGLLRLIDDSKPVGDALAQIGISQRDVNGEMRSGKDIFLDVAGAFKTLDENQKLVVTSQLVGVEQAAKMVVVFDNLAKVQNITNAAMAETGSVTDEVALRLASAGKQIDIATTSFINLAAAVGQKLLPGFGEISEGTTEIIQSFKDIVSSGGLAPLFDELDTQGKEFGDFLKEIAKALPEAFANLDLGELINSFSNLKDSIAGLFGGLDLTSAAGLETTLQNLVDFVTLLTNASAGAVKGLEPLVDGVVSFLEALADSDSDTQGFLGQLGGIATSIDTILPLFGFLADVITTTGVAFLVLSKSSPAALLTGISTSLSSISPTNVALAGAIASVTFAINENIDAYDDLQQRNQSVADSQENLAVNTANISDRLKEISDTTRVTVTSMDQLNEAVDSGLLVFDNLTGKYVDNIEASKNYDGAVSDATASTFDWEKSVNDVGTSIVATEVATKKSIVTVDKATKATDDLAKKQAEAVRQTNALELQLLELASNERIAQFEFAANVKIAEFEADAEKFVAITEGLSSVAISANQVITDLFSHEAPDWDKFGFATESAVRAATTRADEANKALIELQKAQTKNIEEKTRQLARGDSEIKISADNLAPELQKVLESLIDNIRIQAINNGLEILV